MPTAAEAVLKTYLQGARDTLVWKLEGLSERDQRLPRTPTGVSLLGIVKHALKTERVCCRRRATCRTTWTGSRTSPS